MEVLDTPGGMLTSVTYTPGGMQDDAEGVDPGALSRARHVGRVTLNHADSERTATKGKTMVDTRPDVDLTDPVRSATSESVQGTLDQELLQRLQRYAGKPETEISARLRELEQEWDIERVLKLNASSLAFIGTLLGATVNKKWLLVPGTVLPFLFQHAVQGWCPPVAVFRRLGVRTQKEIELEKYALKLLRGDFDLPAGAPDAEEALRRATR